MDTPPPPAAPPKKKGCGCFAIGCLILTIIVLLFAGVVSLVSYLVYSELLGVTSASPATIQTFDGGDDVYNQARQKLSDFNQALQTHQAATLQLSADEINTLISHDPDFARNKIQLFVVLHDDQAEVQASFPTELFTQGYFFKDRYLNGDLSFGLTFDSSDRQFEVHLRDMQIGPQKLEKKDLPLLQEYVSGLLNQALQKNPQGRSLVLQAKSIEIKGSLLVIEIQ